uniref:Uncharacterized protein n=1 Tax=Pyramimonas orientalis virus TaxID=455367 RepID=A0A7M3UP05_POV01|nr:hypothetical protein HWQ62_00320 [Pyramimonas orientalis virus]
MVEYLSFSIALVLSVGFIAYMLSQNKTENIEEKKDNSQMFIMFIISFVVIYMISNLIIDSNDNKHVMSHIKLGEPPF